MQYQLRYFCVSESLTVHPVIYLRTITCPLRIMSHQLTYPHNFFFFVFLCIHPFIHSLQIQSPFSKTGILGCAFKFLRPMSFVIFMSSMTHQLTSLQIQSPFQIGILGWAFQRSIYIVVPNKFNYQIYWSHLQVLFGYYI